MNYINRIVETQYNGEEKYNMEDAILKNKVNGVLSRYSLTQEQVDDLGNNYKTIKRKGILAIILSLLTVSLYTYLTFF